MAEEKNYENKIKAYLKSKGAYFVKYFGCGYTQAGVPDILCCYKGKFIAIEVKAQKGRVSELQKYNIEQIQKAGGIAFVSRPSDFEEFKKMLDKI